MDGDLEIDPEGVQGPTWTKEPKERDIQIRHMERERESVCV